MLHDYWQTVAGITLGAWPLASLAVGACWAAWRYDPARAAGTTYTGPDGEDLTADDMREYARKAARR